MRLAAAALLLLAGCDLITDSFRVNNFSGDAYPIHIDESTGAVVVGIREDGVPDRIGIIDVLSPVTIADSGTQEASANLYANLTIMGAASPGGALNVPRAEFTDTTLYSAHPCDAADCSVGTDDTNEVFSVIIGGNSLAGDALRLRLGDDEIFVLADVGGSDTNRTQSCDAVFDSPYRGGGTLVIAGTETSFGNYRPTVQACLGPDSDATVKLPQQARGTDAEFVISTAIGTSILGEVAYSRYVAGHPSAPALADLPMGSVYLPSGPVTGHVATLPALTLVATSGSNPRAPCRQAYSSHFFMESESGTSTGFRECHHPDDGSEDCPCDADNTDEFCAVPGIVELTPAAGVPVLVIPDSDPTLQALRIEESPDQPEVDGLLGNDVLGAMELDLDYPHDRILGRCTTTECQTRPEIDDTDDRDAVCTCIEDNPGGPDCHLH
ncbi:MAG TPA: hypothetical protein VGM88_27590 [Kofleriaceae bacterium]